MNYDLILMAYSSASQSLSFKDTLIIYLKINIALKMKRNYLF